MADRERSGKSVKWIDRFREPRDPPNPDYPRGLDWDVSKGAARTCLVRLPYPAKRCGFYVVTCDLCHLRIVVTTAGRPDDPRSVKLACRPDGENPGKSEKP